MGAPGHLAEGLVIVATSALPRGETRSRYRREMLADMFAISRGRRLRYAIGVASTAWSLRNAVAGSQTAEVNMMVTTDRRPLLCRLDLRHKWRVESTPDGIRYFACAKCGKEREIIPLGPWGGVGIDPSG